MGTSPKVSVTAATGLIEAIRTADGDPTDPALSGWSGQPSDPHGFIACSDFARVLEEAARRTGDDCFGLHFGEGYNPKGAGPVTYVVLNSPDRGRTAERRTLPERAQRRGLVSFVVEGRFAYAPRSPTWRWSLPASTTSTAWRSG